MPTDKLNTIIMPLMYTTIRVFKARVNRYFVDLHDTSSKHCRLPSGGIVNFDKTKT